MEPYTDTREHLLDELERLNLLLRIHLEEWWAERGGAVDEWSGLYISDEEVDRLLWSPRGDGGGAASTPRHGAREFKSDHGTRGDPELFERVERVAKEIRGRKRRALDEGTKLRLVELAERFDLGPLHSNALLVGLAPELDPKYEKVYAYLQDDITKTSPSVGLVLELLCNSAKERLEARELFSSRSSLIENRLLRLSGEEGVPLPSRFVTVDERIVDFLLGNDEVDDELAGLASLTEPEKTIDDLPLDGKRREELETLSLMDGDRRNSDPPMIYFHGPYGSGTETAVEALCAETETPILTVDAGELAKRDVRDAIGLVIREARLQGAALHVANAATLSTETEGEDETNEALTIGLEDVLRAVDEFDGRVFLSGERSLPPQLGARIENHEFAASHFPVPSYARRKELWNDVDSLPESVDTADLAAKFRLTEGQIGDAIATARTLANGEELSPEAVYRGCRAQSREKLGSLARKIEPNYAWDDIVLPADRMDHLREVAAHIKHQGTVYADWGFEDKFSLGNGLNVLFTGPSGTGKTMAAEIIAGDAGLDLYKIDLASVVSKYIGETEKNLRKIFDEAEDSSAILFFDEADSLFGKRSEVRDAHDRYANIEVNYLLQRVEEHDGTVILTTNFEGNIDDAFLRRIHLSVDFPRPDRESREKIWRNIFPESTPLGDLDIEFLTTFEIAGGNIKNIALTAAFLAADDGDRVEMEHVVRAARRELQKTGKLIDPDDFGEYGDLIRR